MAKIYEQRVVLFLDILGFRALIKQRKEAELMDVLRIPAELQKQYPFNGNTSMQLTAFSDSIVVSDLVGDGFGNQTILHYASYLWFQLLGHGIMARGGIASGELHHEQGRVFGPAMNEAYELESEFAIYPRIVLSDAVVQGAFNSINAEHPNPETKRLMSQMLRRDFDGIWHVHVLAPVALRPRDFYPKKVADKPGEPVTHTLEEVNQVTREKIEAVLKGRPNGNLRVSMKYDWLSNYCEHFLPKS